MRNRQRNIVLKSRAAQSNTHQWIAYDGAGHQVNQGMVTHSTPYLVLESDESKIADALGRSKPNPCGHYVRHITVNDSGTPASLPNDPPPGIAIHSDSLLTYWVGNRHGKVNSESSWNPFDSSTNTIPTQWSISTSATNESVIINDLLERASQLKADHVLNLVEGNKLWPTIRELALLLPKLRYNWSSISQIYRKAGTLNGLFRAKYLKRQMRLDIANGYLAWKYGLKPLIQDLQSTVSYASSLRADIQRTKDLGSQRFTKTVGRTATYNQRTSIDYTIGGINVMKTSYTGAVLKAPVDRYVLVVKPPQQYLTDAFASLDTVMRRFTTSPASLAWEIIPFSFVVDWFVDVRGVLRGIDDLLGHMPFKIVSFTKSTSYELLTQITAQGYNPVGGGLLYDDYMGSIRFKNYTRSLVSAGANAPVWKPHFGKSQAAVTAALITQQLSKLR